MRKQPLVVGAALAALLVIGGRANAQTTCRLDFALKGWSAIVSSATGDGVITCDNGQRVGSPGTELEFAL